MSTEKQTVKLRIKPHRFNSNEDWKNIKKEISNRFGYHINKAEVNAVWNTYCGSFLQDKLVNDDEFVFLSKLGKLNICKEHILDNKNLLRLIKAGSKVQSHNRVNYHYPIVYNKGNGIAKDVKFEASKILKKKLKTILNTTNKEYKPKLIINPQKQ